MIRVGLIQLWLPGVGLVERRIGSGGTRGFRERETPTRRTTMTKITLNAFSLSLLALLAVACGDAGDAQFDDGNLEDADGCSSACKLEAIETEGQIVIDIIIDDLN